VLFRSIVIKPGATLTEAFESLIANNILSAPVEDKISGYVGFLDIRALTAAVVSVHKSDSQPKGFARSVELGDVVAQLTFGDTSEDPDTGSSPANVLSVWTPAYMARLKPIRSVQESDSLLDVCRKLALGHHRVAVINEKGIIIRILSQSWLMNELASRLTDVQGVAIGDLGIVPKNVIKSKASAPAIEAFKLMDKQHIGSLPLVDDDDHILGQAEAGSLCEFLKTHNIKHLTDPISDFAQSGSVGLEQGKRISFKKNTTLGDLLSIFANTHSHRLFFVDDENKVVGVASLKDVLAAVL